MNRSQKKMLYRILGAGALFAFGILLSGSETMRFLIFFSAWALIGWDILLRAVQNIFHGQIFGEHLLMSIATIGAFCLGEYPEGAAVMLFYQVGELFQSCAVGRSRRSIAALMDIRPESALVSRNGELLEVSPEDVRPGEVITVRPGQRVPLDGIVLTGSSALDTSALTGEAMPADVMPGSPINSGCINLTGVLTITVSKAYEESTVARILEMVENAGSKKARAENFITRFAKVYTPAVVIAAVLLATLPPLITGQPFTLWVSRALTFLVISCPCALVISVPLSFFGGIGGASRSGILVKGSVCLEALADTEIMVFDKTGTLTKGEFHVSQIHPVTGSQADLLETAALVESCSTHPVSLSIQRAFGKTIDPERIQGGEEVPGNGVKARVDGRLVMAGNQRFLSASGIQVLATEPWGTAIHLAVDGVYAGYLLIEDELKEDAAQAMPLLKRAGIRQTVMLTGDRKAAGQKVGEALGLDTVYAELLPQDKVDRVEELMLAKSSRGKLAYVGDGINDAPVLARADIGIAMGGLGSDAAIEAADVVIMTDEPSRLVSALEISRKTLRIVRQNIVFALGVKGLVLILGAMGYASMWAAVFADVGVSVIAILNAMRALEARPAPVTKEVDFSVSDPVEAA